MQDCGCLKQAAVSRALNDLGPTIRHGRSEAQTHIVDQPSSRALVQLPQRESIPNAAVRRLITNSDRGAY